MTPGEVLYFPCNALAFAIVEVRGLRDKGVVWPGVADAFSFDGAGQPNVMIDWKSGLAPSEATLTHYRAQVSYYLHMTEANRVLIVLETSKKTMDSVEPFTEGRPRSIVACPDRLLQFVMFVCREGADDDHTC